MGSRAADDAETREIVSVAELTAAIKGILEPAFGGLWVRGEVSNFRRQSSGHLYFSLKDEEAQISAVMFRSDAARVEAEVRNGMQALVYGRITVYGPRGNYQLVVRTLEDDGLGRLRAAFEALKRQLSAEGLFSQDRKQPLPSLPRTVAVVTSPSGAALRDFLRILLRRDWRGTIRLFPARVQGSEAAPEIEAQLDLISRHRLADLAVVMRGGGSLEDLWPFNEERVVRAVARCQVPVISAVGHEIDFCLSDFVADVRAETPSAAAELITSGQLAYLERLERARERFADRVGDELLRMRNRLELLAARLKQYAPENRLEQAFLRLDDLSYRLRAVLQRAIAERRYRLDRAVGKFDRIDPERQLRWARERLDHIQVRLDNVHPRAPLSRGYAIIRKASGRVATGPSDLPPGSDFFVEMADGTIAAEVKVKREQSEFEF